jgi:hypothetical protein
MVAPLQEPAETGSGGMAAGLGAPDLLATRAELEYFGALEHY